MRYVVYGAGAVGGTIGAQLHQAGVETTLIARGAHLEAMRRGGMRFVRPSGESVLDVACAGSPAEAAVGPGDVVIVATKTHDAGKALDDLALVQPDAAVVCATNGVEAERMALRRFEHVYGMGVMLPATHMEPGVVLSEGAPAPGMLDVGRYPAGTDDRCRQICADLTRAGFLSDSVSDIMEQKYGKLLLNTINAVDAAVGRDRSLIRAVRAEARAVFDAAGIEYRKADDDPRRAQVGIERIAGYPRIGSSSAQSLARGAGTIEADYLAGEIVLLGRLHGIPTPVNARLQQVNREMAAAGEAPGSRDALALMAELGIDADPDADRP